MVYLSQRKQRCGKMLGKSPNRTNSNSSTNQTENLLLLSFTWSSLEQIQLEEAPSSRLICGTDGCGHKDPSLPHSPGWGWTREPTRRTPIIK